jgi:hypothetical protein
LAASVLDGAEVLAERHRPYRDTAGSDRIHADDERPDEQDAR